MSSGPPGAIASLVTLSWALREPLRRQAWTSSSRPPPAKPEASSVAPKPAEPATRRLVSTSKIETSQSPALLRSAAETTPLAGIRTVFCTTPAVPADRVAVQSVAPLAGAWRVVVRSESADAAGATTASARAAVIRARARRGIRVMRA